MGVHHHRLHVAHLQPGAIPVAGADGSQAAGGAISRSIRPDGVVRRVVDRRRGEFRAEGEGGWVVGISYGRRLLDEKNEGLSKGGFHKDQRRNDFTCLVLPRSAVVIHI